MSQVKCVARSSLSGPLTRPRLFDPFQTMTSNLPAAGRLQPRQSASHVRRPSNPPNTPPSPLPRHHPLITDVGIYARRVAFTHSVCFRDTCMQKVVVVHSTFVFHSVDSQHQTLFAPHLCVLLKCIIKSMFVADSSSLSDINEKSRKKKLTQGLYPVTKCCCFFRPGKYLVLSGALSTHHTHSSTAYNH